MAPPNHIVRGLSAAQRAFWDKQNGELNAAGVIVGLSIDIFAEVQPELFRAATQAFVDHSDAIRTSFDVAGGVLSQIVSRNVVVTLEVRDLSGADETDESRARVAEVWSNKPFDLSVPPLIDHLLVRVAPDHWTWHTRAHHLVIDAAGAAIGIGAILDAYAALVAGGSPNLSHLGRYSDHLDADAAYIDSEQYRHDRAYWIDRHPAEPKRLFRAGEGVVSGPIPPKQFVLARPQYDALVAACREEGVQPFHAFIACLAALAYRLFGRTGVSLGLATHNRTTELDRRTVGLFAGMMAFRLELNPRETLDSLAWRASRQLRRDYRHARFPLNHLATAIGHDVPLFDLALSFYPAGQDMDVTGARVRLRAAIFAGEDTEPAAIHIRDPQGDSPLGIDLTHRPDLVRGEDVVAMYDGFVRLLAKWPNVRSTTIADLMI